MPDPNLNKIEIQLNKQQAQFLLWNTLLGANGIIPRNLEADINYYEQLTKEENPLGSAIYTSVFSTDAEKKQAYNNGFDAFKGAYNRYIASYGDGTKSVQEIENYVKSIASNPIQFLRDNGASQEAIENFQKIQGNSKVLSAFQNYDIEKKDLINAGYKFPDEVKQQPTTTSAKPAVTKQSPPPPTSPANASKGSEFKVENPENRPVIVIDVGHGWNGIRNHPGAEPEDKSGRRVKDKDGNLITEYQLNLKNSAILKEKLEEKGFFVVLTSDVRSPEKVKKGEDFSSRYQVAAQNDAALYISMHADANESRQPFGIIAYYDKDEPLKNGKNLSQQIAGSIAPKALKKDDERRAPTAKKDNNGNKTAIYNIPAVLLEMGNTLNETDLANLQNEDWLNTTFSAMADNIAESYTNILGANKGALTPPQPTEVAAENQPDKPTQTEAPQATENGPKFDEEYRPAFENKSGSSGGIFDGVDKGDFGRQVLNFITEPNGTPVMNLFLMIFKAIGAIVGIFVGKNQGDAVANMGYEFKNEIITQIAVSIRSSAESLGLDVANKRYSMTEESFKKMTEFRDNLIDEGANFLKSKLTATTSEEDRKKIFEEFKNFMADKIKEKSPKFEVSDFVEILLEKDGKTAYFFEEGNKTKIVYLDPNELAKYGAELSKMPEEVKKYDGIYWPVEISKDGLGRG